jgi:hypothetical protein
MQLMTMMQQSSLSAASTDSARWPWFLLDFF